MIRKQTPFNKIRQCRPNMQYGLEEYRNIGFFNKNRRYIYNSYSDKEAENFILVNFGEYIKDSYLSIDIPQARSDFFLIASLYCEGGISSDVCSTCTSTIDFLIKDSNKLHIVMENNEFQKKFLYSPPRNKIIGSYLDKLLEKISLKEKKLESYDYLSFSSQNYFNFFIKDEIDKGNILKSDIEIISNDEYTSTIKNDLSEEMLLEYSPNNHRVSIRGIVGNYKGKTPSGYNKILGSINGDVLIPSNNSFIIGDDKHPNVTSDLKKTINIPDLEVYEIPNVTVSGHGCIWKDNTFLRLESYLSIVAEEEMEGGFWKSPSELPASVSIDSAILAFGAGYGCYGHYLVDEIPRLALVKKILGAEIFNEKKIVLPEHTPEWGINLIKFFLELKDENIVKFDHTSSSISVDTAIIPTYTHKNYNFHRFLKDFFGFYKNETPEKIPHRRICLSRKDWEQTKTNQRIFLQQDLFEHVASSRGFEIISPESLSLPEQIKLLRETRCQVGEHGSAQHASIYNPYGSTIGTINPLTEIQSNLGRLYNDTNVILFSQEEKKDDKNNTFYSISEKSIIDFFDEVERQDESRKYYDYSSMTRYFDGAR